MPIVSTIEAKSPRGRLLHAGMFVALTLGALVMIYPFAIMVSGSMRTEIDEADLDFIPSFLVDERALYRKFLETKYNEDVAALNRAHERHAFSFRGVETPATVDAAAVADFNAFWSETNPPQHWRVAGGVYSAKGLPTRLRQIHDRLAARFDDNLESFSAAMGSPILQWNQIRFPPPHWLSRQFEYPANPVYEAYFAAADAAPRAEQQLVDVTGYFLELVITPKYGQTSTASFNAAHGTNLSSFGDFSLPDTVPEQPALRDEWISFVRRDLNPSFIVLRDVPAAQYQAFLKSKYKTLSALNRTWAATVPDFGAIALPSGEWLRGMARQDYLEFLLTLPPESYRIVGPEFAWRDWQRERFGDVKHARMPIESLELAHVRESSRPMRWQYVTGNYHYVFGELFTQGNAFRNTMIFCALAVLAAVIVNPLAAYAMSRFRLRGTYNLLLILMATVAFPPMVTLIPKFILLRNLDMLNTFAALVLPFAANGYLIFLLKSFFDSLPRELYEAAEIDGASEMRIFWQITMSLSTPILAVVALEAFNAAYTMFLYALIVCPREDMWVQTVWLSQFQTRASTSAMFASVLVTCIPTLLVFVAAQRVIMRGIIVPTEK